MPRMRTTHQHSRPANESVPNYNVSTSGPMNAPMTVPTPARAVAHHDCGDLIEHDRDAGKGICDVEGDGAEESSKTGDVVRTTKD